MVHFPEFARARLWIHRAVRRFYLRGFHHSDIPGSKPACGSPRLIAACHVLHRLLPPRHPPCALSSLTIKFTQHMGGFSLPALRFWLLAVSSKLPLRRVDLTEPFSAHRAHALHKDAHTPAVTTGTPRKLTHCLADYPIYSVVKHRPREPAFSHQSSAISQDFRLLLFHNPPGRV